MVDLEDLAEIYAEHSEKPKRVEGDEMVIEDGDCWNCYHWVNMNGVYGERSYCKIGCRTNNCGKFINKKNKIEILEYKIDEQNEKMKSLNKDFLNEVKYYSKLVKELDKMRV